MAAGTLLLTAEEFARLPDSGGPRELVRGVLHSMPPPSSRRGQICGKIHGYLFAYVDQHDLGHVLCNDAGVITDRDPDTVRGADVLFYSYQRVPRGPIPDGEVLATPPELIFEVISPSDRWSEVQSKVLEYLGAGVDMVCVAEPEIGAIHVFEPHSAPHLLRSDDTFVGPGSLSGFQIVVKKFFQ